MVNDIIVGATVKSTLTSIQRSREALDRTSERIATGKRVNRPTDQRQNFFTAKSLNSTANNYNRLLDKMGLGVRTIQEALIGLEAIENVLSVTQGDEILFYGAGGLAAKFDGSSFIAVPVDDSINTLGPYDEKTIELVFNADTTSGRQVLFEEGGPVNNLSIYIDNGDLRVNGRTTSGGYGPLDISVPIEAGVTYTVALVQDANNNRFSGFLNGEEFGSAFIPNGGIGSHPNRNAIGAIDQDIYFHDDGPGNAPNRPDGSFAFRGEISDVAFYNSIISQADLRERYEATSLPLSEAFRAETQEFLKQVQSIVDDTSFRGINLLDNEDLIVDFNDQNTSKLKTDGGKFSIESLGLESINFQKPSQVEDAIASIRAAIAEVRDYGFTLTNDLNIIESRQDFSRNLILNHKAGATDLTIADLNQEGANLLSQQVRLDLGTQALSLASQSQATILQIFGSGSDLF